MDISVVVAALRYGAGPEKWMGWAIIWLIGLSQVYYALVEVTTAFQSADLGLFLIDLSVCVIMVTIALRANRMYTLWIAGFQLIALLAHLAMFATNAISPITYAVLVIAPSYFQTIILAFGIWLHHRRVKSHGNYRSWRTSSPRLQDNLPRG
ncbi:hypothetical protein GCM10023115_08930 [Pontixanthobacter gangjinensis]|uniref:Uncharacterized protein n=1 Tax=Pontixanthobacter gangjinensis TaxID=1028742 RepID=A0A6I4SK45_9SPHN|nr:hypothetical protein [Pontixanthobacter gangjinensis]MXO56139.1 hypothetical protein [Pontixanthobacter gangjinensis]